MKIFNLALLTICIASLLSACGTTSKIAALKPEPSYTTDIVYDKQISYANIPLEIQVADLQNQTNTYLSGLIYEDANLEDDTVAHDNGQAIFDVLQMTRHPTCYRNDDLQVELPRVVEGQSTRQDKFEMTWRAFLFRFALNTSLSRIPSPVIIKTRCNES
jgi:hypothetical protein